MTPLIGTLLVLAITVAGMGVVLFFGAPLIARLQDQAALRAVVAQFEEVRHAESGLEVANASAVPGLSPPHGTTSIEPGSRILVTTSTWQGRTFIDLDPTCVPNPLPPPAQICGPDPPRVDGPPCDFHVTDWSDGDDQVLLVNTCWPAFESVPGVPCGQIPLVGQGGTSCLYARRVGDGAGAPDRATVLAGGLLVNLDVAMGTDEWYIRLASEEGETAGTTYAEAWLLNTDRLHWTRSSVGAYYEGGAVLALDDRGQYLSQAPFVSEDAFGNGSAHYFLRLPTLEGSPRSSFVGEGSHSLYLTLQASSLRTRLSQVDVLRFDFQGDLAEVWCNSLVARNTLDPPPSGFSYADDDTNPLVRCAPFNLVTDPGVRSVTYRHALPTVRFDVTFTEAEVLAAILL